MARHKRSDGYILVKRDDIATTKSGYMMEHRAVWIDNNGPIPDGAVVHHINGNPSDNRIENLELYESNGQHRHECHVDLSWLDPDRSKLKGFTLKELEFVRAHLPIDRVILSAQATR